MSYGHIWSFQAWSFQLFLWQLKKQKISTDATWILNLALNILSWRLQTWKNLCTNVFVHFVYWSLKSLPGFWSVKESWTYISNGLVRWWWTLVLHTAAVISVGSKWCVYFTEYFRYGCLSTDVLIMSSCSSWYSAPCIWKK